MSSDAPKKQMTPEALERLAKAREKANAKRRELAEQRKAVREQAIEEKMAQVSEARARKVEKTAEREARRRLASEVRPTPEPSTAPPKAKPIVIEHSDSDQEDDIVNAKVYYVKRSREPPQQPPAPPPPRPPPQRPPDPHESVYRQLFGGTNSYAL